MSEPVVYQACSLHEPLAAVIGKTGSGRVLGGYRRAVNLELDDGVLLSLLDPSLGNGPGAVLLPAAWPLGWSPGDRVLLSGGLLSGPGCAVRLAGARLWAPPAPSGWRKRAHDSHVPADVISALAAAGSPSGLLPAALSALGFAGAAQPPLRPEAAALREMGRRGIERLRSGDWETGVLRLAGLGPGATPSGDDLLAGFTCTLVRAGHPEAGALTAALRRIPESATTRLSRHFLRWSTVGVAGEHGLRLVDAMLHGSWAGGGATRFLGPVLSHGASSGADWASGAILAFDYLGREVDHSEAV